MSYLDTLLQGAEVEWKTLGDVVDISNIGVDKKINANEKKVRLLNFVDVFKNQYISNETPTMVVTASDKKIIDCNVKKDDIFITPSSELIDEIGFSAMAIEDFDNAVYSYHIMRLRINDKNLLFPAYLNFLFSSSEVRKQIRLKAQGITRFGLTQPNWKLIQIPIPPLSIQKEIVHILDTFTDYTAELTTELTARKKQYNYYREQLLSFDISEIKHLPMGDESIGKFIRGGGLQKKDFTESGIGCIHYGQIYTYYGTYAEKTKTFVSEEFAKKARMAQNGDLVIATTSENDEDVCKAVTWLGKEDIAVSSDACFYKHKLNPKYVAYFFQTEQFQKQKRLFITGTKVRRVNADDLAKIKIPVPSIEEQNRIVTILDKFDTLTTSISEGLPKEIDLRKKQYEYYRYMLLTFPKKETA
jgi:type I restriction enzyme S subunit